MNQVQTQQLGSQGLSNLPSTHFSRLGPPPAPTLEMPSLLWWPQPLGTSGPCKSTVSLRSWSELHLIASHPAGLTLTARREGILSGVPSGCEHRAGAQEMPNDARRKQSPASSCLEAHPECLPASLWLCHSFHLNPADKDVGSVDKPPAHSLPQEGHSPELAAMCLLCASVSQNPEENATSSASVPSWQPSRICQDR